MSNKAERDAVVVWIDDVIKMADSYPRDDAQKHASEIVEAYEAGVCTKHGQAVP